MEENAGISICRRNFSQGSYSNIIFPLDKNEIRAVFARTFVSDLNSSPLSMTFGSQYVLESSPFFVSAVTLTATAQMTPLSPAVTLDAHVLPCRITSMYERYQHPTAPERHHRKVKGVEIVKMRDNRGR